jgi:hypothetical protein
MMNNPWRDVIPKKYGCALDVPPLDAVFGLNSKDVEVVAAAHVSPSAATCVKCAASSD